MPRLVLLLVAATGFMTFFLLGQERQAKLAVMEIDDKSRKLDRSLLENAADALRAEIGASNKFVLISKDRQRKAMIKGAKKESWKECYDQSCRIELGQALTADRILTGVITYFGKKYTLTVELIDLAKEATVRTAKADFDGTEKTLAEAIKNISDQIVGRKKNLPVNERGSFGSTNTMDLYNKARDIEESDRERAMELYHDILIDSDERDRYNLRARERLRKMGDKKLLGKECREENKEDSCYELGRAYVESYQTTKAMKAYEDSCILGHGLGCFALAKIHGQENDMKKAREFFRKACDYGVQECCVAVVAERYQSDPGGDSIEDLTSSLVWQKNSPKKKMNYDDAMGYCKKLRSAAYDDWRLPSISELKTLVVGCQSGTNACGISDDCLSAKRCYSGSCYCKETSGLGEKGYYWQGGLWGGGGDWFWSSSMASGQAGYVWGIDFSRGALITHHTGSSYYVRCVRGGKE